MKFGTVALPRARSPGPASMPWGAGGSHEGGGGAAKILFAHLLRRDAPALLNFGIYPPYSGVGGVHGHNHLGRG